MSKKNVKKDKKFFYLKKILGFILIIVGLILHLIPLFPAGWIIILGIELIGFRFLFIDKIKSFLKHN